MQPTALHWTSTFGDSICRISGVRPPSWTMRTLFSAAQVSTVFVMWAASLLTVYGQVSQSCTGGPLDFDVWALKEEQDGFQGVAVNFPHICSASVSHHSAGAKSRRTHMPASPSFDVPRSVISAKVKLALRCRSIFSEKTRVLRARRGSPEKKSVSPRCCC